METKEALESLGLQEKEINIYMALLELNESSVALIAKKSGVKRPTAYVVLRELEEKGFVSHTMRGNRTLYAPQHPQKLLTEAQLRVEELSDVMPQLTSLFEKKKGRPRIVIYEGKERLDRANDEMFMIGGDVFYIGTLKLSMDALPRTYSKTKYIKFGPEFRVFELIEDCNESKEYAERVSGEYRTVRFMPQNMLPFEADIAMFGNRVLITSVKKEYFTISIESDELSHAFRNMFQVIWGISLK